MRDTASNNHQNIKALAGWEEPHSVAECEFLFRKVGQALADDENQLNETEKQLMSDLLCRIIGDVELEIRKELAEKLAPLGHVPRKLMVFLANSDIEVAYPILKNSTLLLDPDLLEIIAHKTSQHQLAIAVRSTVSEAISKALCEAGDEMVTVELLNNPGASISNQLLEFLVEKSETEVNLQAPLIKRPQLPPHLAQKMYQWVSAALKAYVVENFEIDSSILDLPEKSVQKTTDKLAGDRKPSYFLVEKLYNAGELTTGFMLKSLRQGDIDLFEFSFAKLSGLNHDLVKHILYNKNKELLAVACKILKLDRIVFSTIYELISSSEIATDISDKSSKQEILECYDAMSPLQAASYMRTSDFLNGKKRLSQLSRLH